MQGFWKEIESTHTFLHLKQLFLINNPAERCPTESCHLDAFEVKSADHKKLLLPCDIAEQRSWGVLCFVIFIFQKDLDACS